MLFILFDNKSSHNTSSMPQKIECLIRMQPNFIFLYPEFYIIFTLITFFIILILFSFSPQNLNVYSEISIKNNNSNNISTNGNNSILFLTQADLQMRNMEKTSLEDKDLLNNNRESAVEDSTIDSN